MMKKLLKYDLKSLSRVFLPVWILVPVMAIFLGMGLNEAVKDSGTYIAYDFNILLVLSGIVFVAVMMAMLVMTILFVIQRFWNGLLKDEGYLMFTLPVTTRELIISKAIAAEIVSVISIVAGIAALVILSGMSLSPVDVLSVRFWFLWQNNTLLTNAQIAVTVTLSILGVMCGLLQTIYKVYAAMALGQFMEAHRVMGSVIAYIGISIVNSSVMAAVADAFNMVMKMLGIQWDLVYMTGFRGQIISLAIMSVVSLIWVVVYHIVTEYVLEKKLNLE